MSIRPLKIATDVGNATNSKFEKLTAVARFKQLPARDELLLLKKIRSGNAESIDKLVDSWEVVVLSIIKQCYHVKSANMEDMVTVGKNALAKLAKREIGSLRRERFLRFGAWYVRQVILEKRKKDCDK